MHFSCQEGEKKEKTKKIDPSRQSSHYKLTRATPCGRGHDCISRETMNDKIWPPGDHMCHLNDMDADHLLVVREEHAPITFRLKNKNKT